MPNEAITHFRVSVDDETMPLLMEQAQLVHCPPPLLLSIIIRDVLTHAKETGLAFAVVPQNSNRTH
jgi:hypothetical protein